MPPTLAPVRPRRARADRPPQELRPPRERDELIVRFVRAILDARLTEAKAAAARRR
jgi:hypothetical protein